jgi:hypothetical protein
MLQPTKFELVINLNRQSDRPHATPQDRPGREDRRGQAQGRSYVATDLPGAQLSPDNRKAAQAMSELQDQLGEYRSLLLRRVLGEKLELDAVASLMRGIAVPADPEGAIGFCQGPSRKFPEFARRAREPFWV